jgi:hypothetical protein
MSNDDELNKKLAEFLEEIIPKSLDDVVRKNRDIASLKMTTQDELDDIYFPIKTSNYKEKLDNWSFVTLRIGSRLPEVILVGDTQSGFTSKVTSPVQQVDLKNHKVITQNGSVYQLDKRNTEEITQYQLLALCSTFNHWGVGVFLGCPPFFY